MLVISRKKGQRVRIGNTILTILAVGRSRVRLGFDGDHSVPIIREEVDRESSDVSGVRLVPEST